jgi:hypothetical protein
MGTIATGALPPMLKDLLIFFWRKHIHDQTN